MIWQRFALAALTATFLFPTLLSARDDQGKQSAPPSLIAKHKEMLEQWQKTTWRLSLELDIPDLKPQAVQYTVLDKDPVPKYAEQVKKMRDFHRQQLNAADTEAAKAPIRNMLMMVEWDRGFKDVTGDNLWLLTRHPGKQVAANVLSSNSPGGKKWVVTKTVFFNEKPVCWCIPVELKIGKHVVVKLNKGNTFDLQTAYDEMMKQSDDRTDAKEPE
jgi:hypothetical protein